MANGMHQAKQPVSALLTGPCGHPHARDRADRAWLASLGALAVVTLLLVPLTAAGAS
jgi:hypothetical protein